MGDWPGPIWPYRVGRGCVPALTHHRVLGNLEAGESSGIVAAPLLSDFSTCGESQRLDVMALWAESGPWASG